MAYYGTKRRSSALVPMLGPRIGDYEQLEISPQEEVFRFDRSSSPINSIIELFCRGLQMALRNLQVSLPLIGIIRGRTAQNLPETR
jgi:hypothetical protein